MLLELLNNYLPTDSSEKSFKQNFIEFIHKYPNTCFDRSLQVGHITASAWLLNEKMDKALLMHHKKLNIWTQMGGHCDGNSNVLEAALREAQEESGSELLEVVSNNIFDLDIHPIPGNINKNEGSHEHLDVRFLVRSLDDEKIIGNHESHAIKWFGVDDQLPTKEESILRMQRKWKELLI